AAAGPAPGGDAAAGRAGGWVAEGEPDARATALPRLAAPELLEDRPLLLPGDARAVVRDGDGDPAPFRRCRPALARLDANDDPPVLGRVLDRVGEQVAEDLADPPLVALDHGDGIGQPRLEGDALRLRGGAELARDLGGDPPHVHRLLLEPELARLGAGDVEDVIDQPERGADRAPDPAHALLLPGRELVHDPLFEELRVPFRCAERVLDVVAEAADEAGPALDRALERQASLLGLLEQRDLVERQGREVGERARAGKVLRAEGRLPRCTMQLENSERIAGIHEWNHQRGAVAALAGRLPLGGAPGDEQRLEMRDDGLGEGARVGGARADALLDVAGNGRDLDLFPLLVDPFDHRAVPADGLERALRDPVDDLVDR